MADLKQFLDFPGLAEYDKLIKEYIKTGSTDEIDKLVEDLTSYQEEQAAKDTAQDEAIEAVGKALDDYKEEQATKDAAQDKALNDYKEVQAAMDLAQNTAINANADAIATLNGDDETEGSVAKSVKDAIDALVANAPETFDTLKEIADWISKDETGTTALINRVADNEKTIEEIKKDAEDLKEYIDTQDKMYFDSILSIENLKITSLFAVKQANNISAAEAIANLEEGKALELAPEQVITENLTIDKSCYIDANGATFEGTVTVPANVEVIIENATFNKPVVVA